MIYLFYKFSRSINTVIKITRKLLYIGAATYIIYHDLLLYALSTENDLMLSIFYQSTLEQCREQRMVGIHIEIKKIL